MPDKIKSSDAVEDYGTPHKFDPDFRGVVQSRSCTDVICLLIFIFFIIGWIVVAVIAAKSGDPERLLYPTDSYGRVCGKDELVKNKPFLLFFDLTRCASPKVPFTGCPTPQVCVEECPQENWFYRTSELDKSKLFCQVGTDFNKKIDVLIKDGDCAAYYVQSQSIAHRCIPHSLENFTSDFLDIIIWQSSGLSQRKKLEVITDGLKYIGRFVRVQEVAEGVVEDIKFLWPYMLGGCVIAMIISFVWILLLRLIAKVMVWVSLILFTGICGFIAYFTFDKYMKVRRNIESSDMSATEREFTQAFSKIADIETTWLIIFVFTVIVFVVCLLILIFLRKRITLAIALINEASKAVRSIASSLFFPLIPYFLHIGFLLFFSIVALLLASSGSPQYRVICNGNCSCSPIKENDTCYPENFTAPLCLQNEAICQFHSYSPHPVLPNLHIYNLMGLFWSMCFVSAFCEMVLSGAFAVWYWTPNKSKDLPTLPITNSLGRTLRYHLGTLAFGSLVIATVRMIRVIFEYIDYKLKKHADYKIIKIFSWCCRCCLWCLEKFLRFVNRNAYIYCSVYGTNFCKSARKSFSLIMRNIVRVVVLDKVTDFLLLIGKLVVTSGMAILSYFVFSGEITSLHKHLPNINYYMTPVVLISLATFFIASAFFDVYSMAVDTLFLCFLDDCERNDGSAEKPYYMTKGLQQILGKRNVVEQEK